MQMFIACLIMAFSYEIYAEYVEIKSLALKCQL